MAGCLATRSQTRQRNRICFTRDEARIHTRTTETDCKKFTSRPVSRVLFGRQALRDDHSSGTYVTARLKQPTRMTHLETSVVLQSKLRAPSHPYLVLLPVGFALPLLLPIARCALTAPFHPYLSWPKPEGGLLSVALSLGSPPAAVSRHRVSMEPGLSSPICIDTERSPGRLVSFIDGEVCSRVKENRLPASPRKCGNFFAASTNTSGKKVGGRRDAWHSAESKKQLSVPWVTGNLLAGRASSI